MRREFHRQWPGIAGGTVAVALSGGKDSATALALTARYLARRRSIRLVAISIDEGIAGYRAPTLVRAAELAERLGVDHRIVAARDRLGTTTDEVAERMPTVTPCSYCGVWRRRLLNDAAREVGADVLVLGFNLDDLAQTVLMNLARGDVARISRMAPHRHRQPGLVPRIAPLAAVPEREVFLYARLAELPFDHGECPHAGRAARNVFREVVWRLEDALPGTRQALLRTQRQLTDVLVGTAGTGAPAMCPVCGSPSAGGRCRACTYLESLKSPARVEAAP